MQISIKADFTGIQRQLDSGQAVFKKAAQAAMNHTMAKAKTAMSKAIRDEFNIKKKNVDEKLAVTKAKFSSGRLEATLVAGSGKAGRGSINLIHFEPSLSKKGKTKGQLTFKIKKTGPRKVVKGAFIGNSGRTVFQRVPGTVMVSRSKSAGKPHAEAIRPVRTIDVPQMFATRRIRDAVEEMIRREFPVRFDHEVRHLNGEL